MTEEQLKAGRARLDEAVDALRELCEPVAPPKSSREYIAYLCARNLDNAEIVARNEPRRIAFSAAVDAYAGAHAAMADDLEAAGYSDREAASIEKEVRFFQALRSEVEQALAR